MSSRTRSQNASSFAGSPPNANRTTLARFSSSDNSVASPMCPHVANDVPDAPALSRIGWGLLNLEPHLLLYFGETGGADAVAELGVGVLADVALQLLPVVLVIPDALAIGADRQETRQLLD